MSKHTAHENDHQAGEKRAADEKARTTELAATTRAADGPADAAAASRDNVRPFPDSGAKAGPGSETETQSRGEQNAAASFVEELGARIASLEAENSNLKDQYLRKAADFENFRKRMAKEKLEAVDFANQSLLLDLIPVLDDFERAIKSAEAARDYDTLHEGIGLIEKRLVSQLEAKWGLVRFESTGKPFDPNRHEAIMMEKVANVTEPTVAEDFVHGFMLKERVVRCAKVKVLMPTDETTGA